MAKRTPDAPGQLTFVVFGSPTMQSNGDGSVTVRPGKPTQWLTPAQFAAQFNVSRESIYRWISEGTIAPKHVTPAGKRKLLINAAAVPECRAAFESRRP